MSVQNTANVQRYRDKITKEGLSRMEITLSRRFINQARAMARQRRMPFWYFVEQAIMAYVSISGNEKRPESG